MVLIRKECYFKTPVINNPVIIGLLGSAYGIHGWLKVFSSTEHNEDIFKYQPWFLQSSDQWQPLELEDWKHHNQDILIKIKSVDNRDVANLMTNHEIIIDAERLPKLKSNEYYWKDLVGCQVITTKGYILGYVQGLIETGSNDVLVVKENLKDAFGIKERLVPFLDVQVIKIVDISNKIIKVDWDPCF